MPYVNVKLLKAGLTPEQKARVISGMTKVLQDELGKDPRTTYVVIEEIDGDNWGVGGETLTVRKQRAK